MSPRTVALLPMRHHSQRVPGKNYRKLAGKPLFHHILSSLLSCPNISQILIDTDSPVILDDIQENFNPDQYPNIIAIERPENLRADNLPMNEILAFDTSQVEADFFIQTHSTNPLLRPETITTAIDTLVNNYPSNDSLFSVTRLQTRLWDQLGRAINHNPSYLMQTQDLPPVYEENSCLYIFTRPNLLTHRNRIGERPIMFEIDASEAWDIDEELDFAIANLILTKRLAESNES